MREGSHMNEEQERKACEEGPLLNVNKEDKSRIRSTRRVREGSHMNREQERKACEHRARDR